MALAAKEKVFKRVVKGFQEFEHVLFKLKLAKLKKNVSWKQFEPKIEDIEHVHVFHSKNSRGKEQQYSTPVGGHFHEIKFEVGKDGYTATCGPALRSVSKKLKTGKWKKVVEPVVYPGDGDTADVLDNHTHDMEYVWSEVMSPRKLRSKSEEDRQRLATMQGPVEYKHGAMESSSTGGAKLEEM